MRLTPRQVVAIAGALFWLASMLVQTGAGGLIALWTHALFIALLLAISSATRLLSARNLLWLFFLGGAFLGLAFLAGKALEIAVGRDSLAFVAGIPVVEDLLKIAPLIVLLWIGRRREASAFGASDVMLMASLTGSGFALVEDAFIRHGGAWTRSLSWLPVVQIESSRHGDHLIAGHPLWAAIAGCTLGIALLVRTRWSWLIGISGFAWSLLDHIANNYRNQYSTAFAKLLVFITADGWLSLVLFVLGVIAVITLDAYVAYGAMPARAELSVPSRPLTWDGIRDRSRFLRARRGYAYAAFRARRASESARKPYEEVAAGIVRVLAAWPRVAAAGALLLVAGLAAGVDALAVRCVVCAMGFGGMIGAIGAGAAAVAGAVGSAMGAIPGPIGMANRGLAGEGRRVGDAVASDPGADPIAAGAHQAASDVVYDGLTAVSDVKQAADAAKAEYNKVMDATYAGMADGIRRFQNDQQAPPKDKP